MTAWTASLSHNTITPNPSLSHTHHTHPHYHTNSPPSPPPPPPPTSDRLDRLSADRRRAALLSADVVACTLSAAGGELAGLLSGASHWRGFDALIVDEAAQALELACLVPMTLLGAEARVVLVGDPQQLPATVMSRHAGAATLAQSMVRHWGGGAMVVMATLSPW